jgi:hypothetical protein
MALHAASYFAGVGTVFATIAVGFGGGVLLTDAFVGTSERTPTLMERRAALSESPAAVDAAVPATRSSGQQNATPAAAPTAQPQAPEQATASQASIASQGATPVQPATQPVEAQPVTQPRQQQQATPPLQASAPTPPQERARLEQGPGRAQGADLATHDAEAKKAAAERRKQERRKWAERRKREMQKIEELTAMTEKVRRAERQREREPVVRSFAAESPAFRQPPAINLYGDEED